MFLRCTTGTTGKGASARRRRLRRYSTTTLKHLGQVLGTLDLQKPQGNCRSVRIRLRIEVQEETTFLIARDFVDEGVAEHLGENTARYAAPRQKTEKAQDTSLAAQHISLWATGMVCFGIVKIWPEQLI